MTGDTTTHPLPGEIDLDGVWWADEILSPNAEHILVMSGLAGAPVVWDLLDDQLLQVPVIRGRGTTWSADGAWLFVGDDDGLVGLHLETGEQVEIPMPDEIGWGDDVLLIGVDDPGDATAAPAGVEGEAPVPSEG